MNPAAGGGGAETKCRYREMQVGVVGGWGQGSIPAPGFVASGYFLGHSLQDQRAEVWKGGQPGHSCEAGHSK